MRLVSFGLLIVLSGPLGAQSRPVTFTVRSARSGPWSDPNTWTNRKGPGAGDYVQIRAGDTVTYDVASKDVASDQAYRMIHVAGTLTFARDRSTRLRVGLLKVQPGDAAAEDGFACEAHSAPAAPDDPKQPSPALEIGTPDNPIPANVTATIQLVYFDGADKETLPAIINCGGRWDLHGAPLNRTWIKLGAPANAGDAQVTLAEAVTGWKVGDRVIVTASREAPRTGTFRSGVKGAQDGNTEERLLTRIEGATLTLDRPLAGEHAGAGPYRSEVANLSRNVVIESIAPEGVRGHTMFHLHSHGSLSYAEFRHLGKEGVLGKYPIHFHLVGASMRGSSVVGVSVWDSHNRWITIHGTDYLLVRDCVGYRSVGHGYFLEDGTEQYNVLDRNLAVQAVRGKPLPKQVLPFDQNEGAGFWWANGRNTLTRNVACENDTYGYRFEIVKRSDFQPVLTLRTPQGGQEQRDVRTIPFLRFEDNESHSEGLYSFNFGEERNPSVHGDRQHPFIARNLTAWETHYALRPNLQFFLMDGLHIVNAAYGVYHPDYDAHVYRNITLNNVNAEPINRGHDDESVQYGSFTYENLTLENCRVGRDPLIQLTCTSPTAGQTGHFRNLTLINSRSHDANVVDLGGGPRNETLQNGVTYYFHDYFGTGHTTKVVSAKFPDLMGDGDYRAIDGFTGKDVRAADVRSVAFPTLLEPVDDVAPISRILSIRPVGGSVRVQGVSQDNGDIRTVQVNGRAARIVSAHAGVVDWEITIETPRDGTVVAAATDAAGNVEQPGHAVTLLSIRR